MTTEDIGFYYAKRTILAARYILRGYVRFFSYKLRLVSIFIFNEISAFTCGWRLIAFCLFHVLKHVLQYFVVCMLAT